MSKAWWKSKTIWVGLAEAMAGGLITYSEYLSQAMAGDSAGWILLGSGLVKIGLRFITTTGVSAK